jgi:hypothetical protein
MSRNLVFIIAAAFASLLDIAVGRAPAAGEPAALADLEGVAVEADVHREQTVRNQKGTASVKVHQNWQISLDPQRTWNSQSIRRRLALPERGRQSRMLGPLPSGSHARRKTGAVESSFGHSQIEYSPLLEPFHLGHFG